MLTSEYLLCNKVYIQIWWDLLILVHHLWIVCGSINMVLLLLNMPCSNHIKYPMKNFLFLTPEITALDTQKRKKEVRTCILRITFSVFPYNTIYFFYVSAIFTMHTCPHLLFWLSFIFFLSGYYKLWKKLWKCDRSAAIFPT